MEEDTRELSRKLQSSFRMSDGSEIFYYSLPAMKEAGIGDTSVLPYSIRVVLESLARNCDGKGIKLEDVKELANWNPKNPSERDIPFNGCINSGDRFMSDTYLRIAARSTTAGTPVKSCISTLEYIATCVSVKNVEKSKWAFPDTLVGTDSHTTMINGLGVVGFL